MERLMVDFTNHNDVIKALGEAKDADRDNRDAVREAHSFIDDKDGQWERNVHQDRSKKPRYTFDLTTAIRDQVAGEIERADLDTKILPTGGEASKDKAKLLDGLIRNIESISGASHTYNMAGRDMVTGGLAGWAVETGFVDDDSFNQDILIKPVMDFHNRIWFDKNAKRQDKADSDYGFNQVGITKEKYESMYPGGSGASLSDDDNFNYCFRKDDIFIAQVFWKKKVSRTLVEMTNGAVYDKDSEEFQKVRDELEEQGVTVRQEDGKDMERKRDKVVVMRRVFDNDGWLEDEVETPFSFVPLIPLYGNYKINDNHQLYRGVVTKAMDPQRVLNYSLSREIEEGALAPRAKTWMTPKQAAGHEDTLQTMNTNADPVQFYNHDPEAPGVPQQTGGAVINPGLRTISTAMQQLIGQPAGMFAANMGDTPEFAQSGVAIGKLQDKGDNGNIQYFTAMEVAVCHTARIIVDAIPRVYDTERQVRILQPDGAFDMEFLNQDIIDNDTGERVTLNDMSSGKYDVTCSIGPSFASRQQESVAGIIEAAAVNPAIMEMGSDILMKNMNFPGSDSVGSRLRMQLFNAGMIPQDQWTDEEQQQALAAQQQAQGQEQEQTPEMLLAQGELMKGQASVIQAQNKQAETAIGVQEKQAQIQQNEHDLARKDAELMQKINSDQTKTAMQAEQNQFDRIMEVQEQQGERQDAILDSVVKMAQALKTIQEAAAGPVIGPGFVDNVKDQSDLVSVAQDTIIDTV
jgi:hypothetical protein